MSSARVLLCAIFLSSSLQAEIPATFSPRALRPSRLSIAPGDAVELRVAADSGAAAAEKQPWSAASITHFFRRSDGRQENRDTLAAAAPDADHASLTIADEGVTLLGATFEPVVATLTAAEFEQLQKRASPAPQQNAEDGRAAPPAPPDKQRVRCRSAAAALIRATPSGQASESSAVATSKSGQPAEIRMFLDPTRCTVGDTLPFKVYIDGDKAPGARLRVVAPDGKTEQTLATNPSGMADIAITSAGVWRIEFQTLVHADRPSEAGADWVLFCGSIMFETPAPAAKEGDSR
ncbi:MAG: DUF4198 domain-containing protein [Planctomycetes bacterium]|nr:DUF4198 domain-containing protein [Planctomycetota bacterium]